MPAQDTFHLPPVTLFETVIRVPVLIDTLSFAPWSIALVRRLAPHAATFWTLAPRVVAGGDGGSMPNTKTAARQRGKQEDA